MTKKEFIGLAANRAEMSQKDIATALDAIESTIMEDIFAKEDSIRLTLGTFSGYTSAPRAERKGRNPATGEEIVIAAVPAKRGQPKVKWSKAAKE